MQTHIHTNTHTNTHMNIHTDTHSHSITLTLAHSTNTQPYTTLDTHLNSQLYKRQNSAVYDED